ncbi:hypothetical protein P22_4021 [Propionispora sp. 2/2-37]|nr:hypothetical protein P22_4021 [Propionispora sp. 2/2-37]
MGGEKLEVGIQSYEDLEVYQQSFRLAVEIHKLTQSFPIEEKRELGYQMRRAAVSIAANIAEGYGRKNSTAEFKHFLRNALGSSNEVSVLLKLAKEIGYPIERKIIDEYEVVGKRLYRLIESWK